MDCYEVHVNNRLDRDFGDDAEAAYKYFNSLSSGVLYENGAVLEIIEPDGNEEG